MGEKIIGIGVDVIEVDRIAALIERHGDRFLSKALTPAEMARIGQRPGRPMYAARHLAVKEAAMKAFGTGLRPGTAWHDIEVTDHGPGRCEVRLPACRPRNERLHAAISRHGGVVVAVATLIRTEEPA